MQCEILTARESIEQLVADLRHLVPGPASVAAAVTNILTQVQEQGDQAVVELTKKFDTPDAEPKRLKVSEQELEAAAQALDDEVREGLLLAADNVDKVARAGLHADKVVSFEDHDEVPLAKSPRSTSSALSPRRLAACNTAAPVMPPPTMSRS